MASKSLQVGPYSVDLRDPSSIAFASTFDSDLYSLAFNKCVATYEPVIDCDSLHNGSLGLNIPSLIKAAGILIKPTSRKDKNPSRTIVQSALKDFLSRYPEMDGLFSNRTTTKEISIKSAEFIIGNSITSSNFLEIKYVIDLLNSKRWNRPKDSSESQSGVSVLGDISEYLCEKALDSSLKTGLVHKVTSNDIKSYGDFVVTCLPNNLWISVKSNFARERLLASGYGNDIIGVGFFQSYREFTSAIRVRNFQKAGFLAMYCPDSPVTEEQYKNKTSTYKEVILQYEKEKRPEPLNINGNPFIRPLSSLSKDLEKLTSQEDLMKRLTVRF